MTNQAYDIETGTPHPEPTKQSICQALSVSYNSSSSKSERTAADTYLQNIKESNNGLNLSIHLFQNTMEPRVLFYCLHVIEYYIDKRWNKLDIDSIIMMNKLLLSFIDVCCKNNLFISIPGHIDSKIAQVLVKLMKRQYLISWHSFFIDLMAFLKSDDGDIDGVWDLFYRILQDLNWSIHENRNEYQYQEDLILNTKIKDKMRKCDIKEIVEIWFLFLTNYTKYDIKLCRQCLLCIDKYIEWIDIKYISAPRFINIFYKLLSIVSFQNESVDCLYEIITKRMESTKKFELIKSINIMQIIKEIDINNINAAFAESIAGLIEGIGIQLIGCTKDKILLDCYHLSISYFSHSSFKVNQQCIEFLFAFWTMMKRKNDDYNNVKMIFNKTVSLISIHLCYPSVVLSDQEEADFDEYRKDYLDKLIIAMTRAYPLQILNLIGNHFSKTCSIILNNDKILWQNIESDLHFIYKICEGFHDRNIDDLIRSNVGLRNLFECSLSVNICSKYRHPKLLLTYFDIIHRYNVFFEYHPQYISQILSLFVVCIQQRANPTLRAHAAYILQKVISKLNNNVLLQYIDMLIQSLVACLKVYINNNNDNESVYARNICGVLGQLVLLNKKDCDCNEICGIFISELKHYIFCVNEYHPQFVSQIMAQYISCVQSFFKPFVNDDCNQCIENILIHFTDIVIKSYSCLPNDDDLRQVSIGFIHKAVYILGNNIVNHLNPALKLYILYMNANNCVFTLQIITNIVLSLRDNFAGILDNMFYPLFDKVIHILSSQDTATKIEIEKHLYTLLLKTFESGCFWIFLSPKNALHFDSVLNYILNGCIIRDDLDISIYKTCFTILKEMLSRIKYDESIKDLFCNKIVKISFDFALHPKYKAKRPEYDRTLKTIIFGIHHLMFKIFGDDVVTSCIGSYLVTQLKLDTNTAKQYCDLCIKGNQQRKLKQIIFSLRS